MTALVRCRYGELGESCCLRQDGDARSYFRCPLFDGLPCPFGKAKEGCGNCQNRAGMSFDGDGNRTVDCAANPWQMFQPYAVECVRWEKSLG